MIYHINRLKKKKHTVISVDSKTTWKILKPIEKILSKLEMERHFLNIIMDIYKKIYNRHHTLLWKTECFPPKVRNKAIVLKALSSAIRKKKQIRGIQNRKQKNSLFTDTITYTENLNKPTKKLSEYVILARSTDKSWTQKLITSLYTSNE